MNRLVACLLAAGATSGCVHLQPSPYSAHDCYLESGWLDSSDGCSEYENYPDCFLVCPQSGLRVRLEDVPDVMHSFTRAQNLH